MRDLNTLNEYRDVEGAMQHYGDPGDHTCGAFIIPSPIDKRPLRVIASGDGGWEHVSVSRNNHCPSWPEMEFIKRMFFNDDEVAMQLHVAAKDHINFHPNCLHLWRPTKHILPLPPGWMVAI